jgi:hypothetical protein
MTTIAALLLFAPACGPAAPESVQVFIIVILATDKDDLVSERIREIAEEAKKKDKSLTGFALYGTSRKSVRMGDSTQFKLVGKAKAEVTVNAKTDNEGRVTLTIKPPTLDELTYSCTCGKFLPILTDYYTPDQKRLIIAVMARPCKKKP